MAIKHYTVRQSWLDLEVTLKVDHYVLTEERAHEINNFWSNPEGRIDEEDGGVIHSVIKQVGQCFMRLMVDGSTTYVPKLLRDFENEEGYGGAEYSGITLIEAQGEIELLLEDMELAEVKVSEPVATEEH